MARAALLLLLLVATMAMAGATVRRPRRHPAMAHAPPPPAHAATPPLATGCPVSSMSCRCLFDGHGWRGRLRTRAPQLHVMLCLCVLVFPLSIYVLVFPLSIAKTHRESQSVRLVRLDSMALFLRIYWGSDVNLCLFSLLLH